MKGLKPKTAEMRRDAPPSLYTYLSDLDLEYSFKLVSPADMQLGTAPNVDILFLDLLALPDFDRSMVKVIIEKYCGAAVIALVHNDDTGLWAISQGAHEYLVEKRFHEGFVKQLINTAINKKKVQKPDEFENIEYKRYFDSSPVAKWIFDIETLRFLDVNEAAVITYGYSRDEFLSMTINDIRPESEVLALSDVVKRTVIMVIMMHVTGDT